jgi:hypothetical protein
MSDLHLDPTEQVIPLGTRCIGNVDHVEIWNFGFRIFAGLFRRNERNAAPHEEGCRSIVARWEREECTERSRGA